MPPHSQWGEPPPDPVALALALTLVALLLLLLVWALADGPGRDEEPPAEETIDDEEAAELTTHFDEIVRRLKADTPDWLDRYR